MVWLEGVVVGAHGLGPWTSSLSETRSNQLSYAPPSFHRARGGPPRRVLPSAVPASREADSAMPCALPGLRPMGAGLLLEKEVIQPQVPLRLPCYDFIPVIDHTLGAFPLCRSDQRFRVQSTPMM